MQNRRHGYLSLIEDELTLRTRIRSRSRSRQHGGRTINLPEMTDEIVPRTFPVGHGIDLTSALHPGNGFKSGILYPRAPSLPLATYIAGLRAAPTPLANAISMNPLKDRVLIQSGVLLKMKSLARVKVEGPRCPRVWDISDS